MMTKSFLAKLFRNRSTAESSGRDVSEKHLELDNLEPRQLFSAGPVEAPVEQAKEGESAADTQPGPVIVSAEGAQAASAAVQQAETTAEAESLAAAPPEQGATEVSENQGVTLVDVEDSPVQLNEETLQAIADAAAERWRATGISQDQSDALDAVEYQIFDFGDTRELGSAEGTVVRIDDDGSRGGWFIDATPLVDEEFDPFGFASDDLGYDLLTAVLHEQGHVLGLVDSEAGLMDGVLISDTRRLPGVGEAEGAVPGDVEGPQFLIAGGRAGEISI